jgi:hypothetical protein
VWLKKQQLPRLSLPEICGYVPLVRFIADAVRDKNAVADGSGDSMTAASGNKGGAIDTTGGETAPLKEEGDLNGEMLF